MSEKPITIRLTAEQTEILKGRVQQINDLTPEASVSVNSIVKYCVDSYLRKLNRETIETQLTFPFCSKNGYYIDEYIAELNNPYFSEEEKVFYSTEKYENDQSDIGVLEDAFASIVGVMEKYNNISPNTLKEWHTILGEIRQYRGFAEMLDKMPQPREGEE